MVHPVTYLFTEKPTADTIAALQKPEFYSHWEWDMLALFEPVTQEPHEDLLITPVTELWSELASNTPEPLGSEPYTITITPASARAAYRAVLKKSTDYASMIEHLASKRYRDDLWLLDNIVHDEDMLADIEPHVAKGCYKGTVQYYRDSEFAPYFVIVKDNECREPVDFLDLCLEHSDKDTPAKTYYVHPDMQGTLYLAPQVINQL